VQSAFAPIELGKKGLVAHSVAMQTVGHNLSNAAVEGYSRQRVELRATEPLYYPQLNREETPGQIGQGVEVSRITRIRDLLLDGRIVSETNLQGFWEARDKYTLMLEQVQNEPTDHSVRTLMDRFWDSWQELSLRPTESAARRSVLETGRALVDGIHNQYRRLKGIRDMLEQDVRGTVEQVNSLTKEIAALNGQITKSEALGDNPNDLYDRRDVLVERLAKLVDITVSNRDPDEFVITSGGVHMVQGQHHEELAAVADQANEGYSRVTWDGDGDAVFRGGTLTGLLGLRDVDARGEIQKLDLMTQDFIDLVNEVHSRGFGLDGSTGQDFFVQYPFVNNAQGNYDLRGTGAFDSTWIFRVTGINSLDPQEQVGLAGTITLPGATGPVAIDYRPTDTVADIVDRINLSGAEVVARLDDQGRLSLKANPSGNPAYPDFVIRGIEDSGQLLVGYAGILREPGAAGAFTWTRPDEVAAFRPGVQWAVAPLAHPSGWITVNRSIAEDPNRIAAAAGVDGRPEGIGDGSIALAIARLRTEPVMIGRSSSFDSFFADRVADMGLRGEEAQQNLDTVKLVIKDLTDTRESLSGVNIDEEVTLMIQLQHGYSAVARFVTTFDGMLDVIINRMAV
jgi:flagellar hook-associated protein 1 FlgK